MNVDQYIGGAEHAVLHLLYSRFFYKFFHDRGWVAGTTSHSSGSSTRAWCSATARRCRSRAVTSSASTKLPIRNGVDAMRLFLLYVTPPEDTSNWTDEGISGRVRFLNRVWRACEPHFGLHARCRRARFRRWRRPRSEH